MDTTRSVIQVPCAALRGAGRAAAAGVTADLAFCHPDIRGVVSVDRATGFVELEVDRDGDDLRAQVTQVVALSVASYRYVRDEPALWSHTPRGAYAGAGALERFVAERVRELGPGQHALVGAAALLREHLDRRMRRTAAAISAEPWHLPSIEDTRDLIRASGYLASHGQHVTFGYRLPTHFDTLRRFATMARERRLERPDDPADLTPTGFILEPFVCHNVYRALRGERLDAPRAITALGTCFRHEGFRFRPLLRQWEFSMREIVLVGSADFVREQRARVVELVQEVARELDLDAQLEIATDPFFVSEAASARAFQAMGSTKLELHLALGDGARTAAASFNLHRDHFTRPMDIRDASGELLETACVGFGLERWMAAWVARWGADPAGWPALDAQ